MESLILLYENRDGKTKARMFANGSMQGVYIFFEEATITTTELEDIITTGVIGKK